MIMVGKLVHGCHHRISLHPAHMVAHGIKKCLSISPDPAVIAVTVLLHPRKEPGHRLHKGVIIHNRVPLISLEPAGRIPIVLRKDQHLRVHFFYRLAEPAPEFVVILSRMSKIRRHIQTPAIDGIGRRCPFSGYVQNILHQLLRLLIIQLGKGIMPPPAIIAAVIGPRLIPLIMELEKAAVGTVL